MFRSMVRFALLVMLIASVAPSSVHAGPFRGMGHQVTMHQPALFNSALFGPLGFPSVPGATSSLRQMPGFVIQRNTQNPMLSVVRPIPTLSAHTLQTLPGGGSVVSLSGSGFRGGAVHLGTTAIQGLSAQQFFAPGGGGIRGLTGPTALETPNNFNRFGNRSLFGGMNPYSSVLSSSPYASMGNSMSAYGGSGGSGGGGYGGGSGGGSGGSPSMSTAPTNSGLADVVAAQTLVNQMNNGSALDSLGLPNAAGRLTWPLGLRVLPPEATPLRHQIDNLLTRAANVRANGQVDETAVSDLNKSIGRLWELLASKDGVLPANTASEARQFLRGLDEAVKGLQ
jgi:hypothetical protein